MDILERLLSDIVAVVSSSTGDVLLLSTVLTLFVMIAFLGLWVYNRKKFQNLSHQIPASVVKNYLDTIIQNSTSLKDSLFRGGGLEVGQGVPSVKPVQDLSSGGVDTSHLQEQINQKNAEIASLRETVSEKDKIIADLEKKLSEAMAAAASGDSGEQIQSLMAERDQLASDLQAARDQLANAPAGGGDSEALRSDLDIVTKERDELQEKLSEYAIIEEDLADLKKLQKENEELKAQLAGGGAAVAAAAATEAVAEEAPPVAEEESEEDLEAAMAAAIDEAEPEAEAQVAAEEAPADESGEEKSAEELLSEFEKMLG